ncbi:MAG TPA: BON domain-containing protein [Azospirillum sp.]|nr:BON domain-containing protein [Azospirillum sp.]
MADYEDRWRNDQGYRRGWEDDRGRWGGRERTGSGRKPGQEHDYGRTMLDDMRRYARGDYDRDSHRDREDYGRRGYGRDDYGRDDYASRARSYERDDRRDEGRGGRDWWDRTSDEVSSWFGDEDAERRRRMDEQHRDDRGGGHRGRGPRGYTRSDERIRDDVNDRLTDDPYVDASDIDVAVSGCEVTLTGTVDSRMARRRAEDIVEAVSGVTHVQNNLRVRQQAGVTAGAQGMANLGSSPGGSTQTTGVVGGGETPATVQTTRTNATTRR